MSFKGFSIFSSGRHFVQPSGAILVILVSAIGGILLSKYFEIRPLAKDEMLFEDLYFLALAAKISCSMKQNYCGHLGFSTDTCLACFDPEVIL